MIIQRVQEKFFTRIDDLSCSANCRSKATACTTAPDAEHFLFCEYGGSLRVQENALVVGTESINKQLVGSDPGVAKVEPDKSEFRLVQDDHNGN
jgi:hypothetical protein